MVEFCVGVDGQNESLVTVNNHLPPTSTNRGVETHPATLDQPRPHAYIDKWYSSTPCGAPTLRIDRHSLEQTFECWNRCHGTRFTHLIMQGIWYIYKLSKEHISDKAEYEPCIHKDKEDRSFKDIQELQREESTKAIPSSPSNRRNP